LAFWLVTPLDGYTHHQRPEQGLEVVPVEKQMTLGEVTQPRPQGI
jgi:hypothetical protein